MCKISLEKIFKYLVSTGLWVWGPGVVTNGWYCIEFLMMKVFASGSLHIIFSDQALKFSLELQVHSSAPTAHTKARPRNLALNRQLQRGQVVDNG